MDQIRLNKIVEANQDKLLPLADASILRFVDEANKFFREPNNSVNHYTRSRDLDPPSKYCAWTNRGRAVVKDAESDRYAIYINFSEFTVSNENVFIGLSMKNRINKYIFMPEVGLYLHTKSPIWEKDQLLVLDKETK